MRWPNSQVPWNFNLCLEDNIKHIKIRLIDALDLLALLALGMSHSTDYAVFNIVQNNISIKQLKIRLIDALDLLALLALGMFHSTDYAVFRSARASCTTSEPVRNENLDPMYTGIYASRIIRRLIKPTLV